ncbi:hypothetical protein MJH12_15270 [bacterium]|nr:hypothetical protein [bacterium]
MDHVKTQIIDDVVSRLIGLPLVGPNVSKTRLYSIEEEKLPFISVYSGDEEIEYMSFDKPRLQKREFDFHVDIHGKNSEDLDAYLNLICVSVEEALLSSEDLSGLVKDLGLESIKFEKEANQSVLGALNLKYKTIYIVRENDVSQAL